MIMPVGPDVCSLSRTPTTFSRAHARTRERGAPTALGEAITVVPGGGKPGAAAEAPTVGSVRGRKVETKERQ
jgi:hypothetical protein